MAQAGSRWVVLVLVFAPLSPMSATADPITITGGSVQVEVNISDARISLTGDDFLLRTGTDAFVTTLGNSPFPSGTTRNLGGAWQGDTAAGEATFNGVHYPLVYFVGLPNNGTFLAPSVTLTGGEGYQTFTVPFTFNGVATAFASQDPAEQPLQRDACRQRHGPGSLPRFSGTCRSRVRNRLPQGRRLPPGVRVFAFGADTGAGNLAAPGYGRSRHGRSSTPQPGSKRPERDDRENSFLTRPHRQTCGTPSGKDCSGHQPLPSGRRCRAAPPRSTAPSAP